MYSVLCPVFVTYRHILEIIPYQRVEIIFFSFAFVFYCIEAPGFVQSIFYCWTFVLSSTFASTNYAPVNNLIDK